jgi:hypothetical protein
VTYELANQPYGWHEYGNYVGIFGALIILLSLPVALLRSGRTDAWLGRTLALSTLLVMSVAVGDFGVGSPAALLQRLPMFENFRLPSRYTVPFVLLSCMTAAWVARGLERRTQITGRRWLVILVCGVATFHIASVNAVQFRGAFSQPPLGSGFTFLTRPPAPIIDDKIQRQDRNSPMLRAMMNGAAVFDCYEPLQLRRTADAGMPIVYTRDASVAHVTAFSPNRIDVAVSGDESPARVFMNQNHAAGWRSTAGPVSLDSEDSRTVAVVPGSGPREFAFVFVPPGLWWGVLTLVVAVAVSPLLSRLRVTPHPSRTYHPPHTDPRE